MRYDREHKAQTRERVLKEAAAAIRLEGPDRLGVAAVMGKAGLTHGGFYAHFKSKDDLLAEAVDYMFADARATMSVDEESTDPRETLGRYVDNYLSKQHRDDRGRGCPVPILAGELHRMPDTARERFTGALERMTQRVAALLERAGTPDAPTRANAAVAEMVGAVALSRVLQDDPAAMRLLDAARRSVRTKLDLI